MCINFHDEVIDKFDKKKKKNDKKNKIKGNANCDVVNHIFGTNRHSIKTFLAMFLLSGYNTLHWWPVDWGGGEWGRDSGGASKATAKLFLGL